MQKSSGLSSLAKNNQLVFLVSSLVVSFGILTVTVGASWDISNHLLNKPETFFSPPHSLLYSGVAVALIGTAVLFFSWRRLDGMIKKDFVGPVRMNVIGIMILVGAGPFDFAWHASFGLDGLLSPSHLTLAFGMILCSVGALLTFVRCQDKKLSSGSYDVSHFLIAVGMLPTLISFAGLFYSFSLPFSKTAYFDFNPDPFAAVIVATLSFPFLFATILSLTSHIANKKFGLVSLVGILFLVINASTLIVTSPSLIPILSFYFLGVIPVVIFDVISSQARKKILNYLAGGLVGSCFYFFFFPLITHTYNEVFSHQIVWPSMTSHIYFEMLDTVFPVVVLPAIVMGMLGVIFSGRIMPKIRHQ